MKQLLREKGGDSAETIEALETFVEKSCEAATYLLDKGEQEEAGHVLEDCQKVLQKEVPGKFPKLLYLINYRQAQLQNSLGRHQESLVFLKQAIQMAEE